MTLSKMLELHKSYDKDIEVQVTDKNGKERTVIWHFDIGNTAIMSNDFEVTDYEDIEGVPSKLLATFAEGIYSHYHLKPGTEYFIDVPENDYYIS